MPVTTIGYAAVAACEMCGDPNYTRRPTCEWCSCHDCGAPAAPGLLHCRDCDWRRAMAAARRERRELWRHYERASGAIFAAERAEEGARDAYLAARRERQATGFRCVTVADKSALADRAWRLGQLYERAIADSVRAAERLRRVRFSNGRRILAASEGRPYRGA